MTFYMLKHSPYNFLKYILVFEYLVNEMPKFLQQFTTQILPPIWQLLTQTADIYVKVVVNQTEPNPFPADNDDGKFNFSIFLHHFLSFLTTLTFFEIS